MKKMTNTDNFILGLIFLLGIIAAVMFFLGNMVIDAREKERWSEYEKEQGLYSAQLRVEARRAQYALD